MLFVSVSEISAVAVAQTWLGWQMVRHKDKMAAVAVTQRDGAAALHQIKRLLRLCCRSDQSLLSATLRPWHFRSLALLHSCAGFWFH